MNTSSACCDSCAAPTNDTALAIACTLGATDFKGRVASIRALSARSLLRSRREGLVLDLAYEGNAYAEVQQLVANETECCAFLDFRLRQDHGETKLTITAPTEAALAADELFAHFAPELARAAA